MSVTEAKGFRAAGIACGIKASGAPDLSLVATDDARPVAAAAVFTSNKATAAPVQVSRAHLESSGGRACAVVLNSGNANAATGESGRRDAERMADLVAEQLGCRSDAVLVCSTGLIGIPLPMDPIESGVARLVQSLREDGGANAAQAIMTTDTVRKETLQRGDGFVVGGMAKGAAMLAPNMATMLAVLTTDAEATPDALQQMLRAGVADSFNAMSVDGCQSTNDTVIILASGRAGAVDEAALAGAIADACGDLARQMCGDAEGATKTIEMRVVGAASDDEARAAARQVAESQLCKCSWYGQDPYWGRIVAELGVAGVDFDPDAVSVSYGDITVCRKGIAAMHDATVLQEVMAAEHLVVTADLGLGDGEAVIWTNDLTHAYIDENMGTS
ncbi:MAG TPA: bifunctional glutamate N-acetyltransferase/amino-acid acetyltransferase ArgJ [Acidimicrobiales bacterium]|nr:bifunctional glutamate N-acetyltransferase/amino-acid acetyltransferase ArgJ [Acidimicrobiales bacterium]